MKRATRTLLLFSISASLLAVGCSEERARTISGPQAPLDLAGKGNGKGGGGSGGGGGASSGTPGVLLFATTGSGLASDLLGDGRDFDGSQTLPAGDGAYEHGTCLVDIGFLDIVTAGAPDSVRMLFTPATRGKRKDPCFSNPRSFTLDFGSDPDFGVEPMHRISVKWQVDQADEIGEITTAIGKLDLDDQTGCDPLRFNPARAGFEGSDFLLIERIDGGWRVATQTSPANIGICEDSGNANAFDFEFFIDEDVGDGAGPGG